MSEENLEVFRSGWDALQRGDAEAWAATVDPEVEWDFSAYPLPDVADRGSGRENLLRFMGEYFASWGRYEGEVTELLDAGDNLVVVLHESVRARGSAIPIERDLFQVWTVTNGRGSRVRVYRERAEALEAAGLGSP